MHPARTRKFLQCFEKLNVADELLSACTSNDVATLRKLSKTGDIDFQATDQSGCTILHLVAKYGSADCAEFLLGSGVYALLFPLCLLHFTYLDVSHFASLQIRRSQISTSKTAKELPLCRTLCKTTTLGYSIYLWNTEVGIRY